MVTHITGRSLRSQIFFWLVVLAIFVAFLWLFSSILLPFVAGMALAYFLDPVADRLERLGLSRMMATSMILLSFVVLFALGGWSIPSFVPFVASISCLSHYGIPATDQIFELETPLD